MVPFTLLVCLHTAFIQNSPWNTQKIQVWVSSYHHTPLCKHTVQSNCDSLPGIYCIYCPLPQTDFPVHEQQNTNLRWNFANVLYQEHYLPVLIAQVCFGLRKSQENKILSVVCWYALRAFQNQFFSQYIAEYLIPYKMSSHKLKLNMGINAW